MEAPAGMEFEILKLLWKESPLSGREIYDGIAKKTGWAYSTTRTVIDRMVKKGLLGRDETHGLIIYHAKMSRAAAFASQIELFADRLLDGNTASMLPLFAKGDVLTQDELRELKEIIANMEERK